MCKEMQFNCYHFLFCGSFFYFVVVFLGQLMCTFEPPCAYWVLITEIGHLATVGQKVVINFMN